MRAFVLVIGVLVVLGGGCSHTVPLRNIDVPVERRAQLGARPARFFVDRVQVPARASERFGVKRSLAGDFWARIYSSGDLSTWAEEEWRRFLRRHGHGVVERVRDAEYVVTCDVVEISADKKYDWIWDDDFEGSVKLRVRIVERRSGGTVFEGTVRGDHFVQRRGVYAEATDTELLLLSVTTAFQNALEQIRFR